MLNIYEKYIFQPLKPNKNADLSAMLAEVRSRQDILFGAITPTNDAGLVLINLFFNLSLEAKSVAFQAVALATKKHGLSRDVYKTQGEWQKAVYSKWKSLFIVCFGSSL